MENAFEIRFSVQNAVARILTTDRETCMQIKPSEEHS